jgi:signal transduction histidine kinase
VKHPIRQQLLIPLLGVLVVVVVSIAACSAWLSWSRQIAALQQRQDDVVDVLEDATFPLTTPVLRQLARLSGQQFLVCDAATDRVVGTSFDERPEQLAATVAAWRSANNTATGNTTNRTPPSTEPIISGTPGSKAVTVAGDEYLLRVITLKRQPRQQVLAFTSQRSLTQARWDALWPPFAFGGCGLLLLLPWLLALTRNWSRRIEHIQQSVAAIADGELRVVPMPAERDDELAALVTDIQRMSQRLQELQTELVQSERERLVAQLAAGFAHQFRNGVAGASLALQLHASRCGTGSDKSLSVAQKQLNVLEAEIRGMLSLAKRVDSPRETITAAELIEAATELALPAIEHHRIGLKTHLPAGDVQVQASRDGLRASLLNLLLNAIDAAGPGGQIHIETAVHAAGVAILVRDNGPGPSPDVAARMTDAFVTTKPEGIGLGLTIVATVAHDHGGRLSYRRDDGWTTFEFWLPLQLQEACVSHEPGIGCR